MGSLDSPERGIVSGSSLLEVHGVEWHAPAHVLSPHSNTIMAFL